MSEYLQDLAVGVAMVAVVIGLLAFPYVCVRVLDCLRGGVIWPSCRK